MGRGQGQEKANYSATDLLFGPRRSHRSISDGPSMGEIYQAIRLLQAGKARPAIETLLRFDEKTAKTEPARQLMKDLSPELTRLNSSDWQTLISGLNQQLSKNPRTTAFDDLDQGLSKALPLRLGTPIMHTINQDEEHFLFSLGHRLSNHSLYSAALLDPIDGMAIGGAENIPHHKRLLARHAVYRTAYDFPDKIPASLLEDFDSPFVSEDVLSDLRRDEAVDLVNALNDSCRRSGGYYLFGNKRGSNDTLHDLMMAKLFSASVAPRQKIYKSCLKDYLQDAAREAEGCGDRLAGELSLSEEGRDEVNRFLADWRSRGQEKLVDDIIEGSRSYTVDSEKEKLAEILSRQIGPNDIDRLPIVKDSLAWQQFQKQHLDRPFAPDRKLDVDDRYWRYILSEALTSKNPFDFSLDPEVVVAELRIKAGE